MWSWAPIVAAVITTVVNILLAFGAYLGRRNESTAALAAQLAQVMLKANLISRNNDERMRRLETDASIQRDRLHDLAENKLSQVLVRLAVLEATHRGHGESV